MERKHRMTRRLLLSVAASCSFAAAITVCGQCPNSSNTSTGGTFCNSSTLTIATGNTPGAVDGSPDPFGISVSGMSGAVSSVSVTLNNPTMPYPADVALMLVAPDGRALTFFGGVCERGADVTFSLSDSGSGLPPFGYYTDTCAATTYKPYVYEDGIGGGCPSSSFGSPASTSAACAKNPNGSNTFTSVFAGATPNGTWKIYAWDYSGYDTQGITGGVMRETGQPRMPALNL